MVSIRSGILWKRLPRCLNSGQFFADRCTTWSTGSLTPPSSRCWTPEILKELSSHYKRPEEFLPSEMVASIIASKTSHQGIATLRQVLKAKFDSGSRPSGLSLASDRTNLPHKLKMSTVIIHTSKDDQDLTKLWCELYLSMGGLLRLDGELPPGQSGFDHITGGYDAGYCELLLSSLLTSLSCTKVGAPQMVIITLNPSRPTCSPPSLRRIRWILPKASFTAKRFCSQEDR